MTQGILEKVHKEIDAVYAELPAIECKGLCWSCCGPIKMTAFEAHRIWQKTGMNIQNAIEARLLTAAALKNKDLVMCPLLDSDKRCTVYSVRPYICRVWGLIEGLICPHGCRPKKWMDAVTTIKLQGRLREIDDKYGIFGDEEDDS